VWVNGNRYANFDPEAMTVTLPEPTEQPTALHPLTIRGEWDKVPIPPDDLKVRVRIVPAAVPFDIACDIVDKVARLTLDGDMDDSAVIALRLELKRIIAAQAKEVVLLFSGLRSISDRCARAFALAQQDLDMDTTISVVGANPEVRKVLDDVGALDGVTVLDAEDTTKE
jgi:anti-anti-sigma regulatory factor